MPKKGEGASPAQRAALKRGQEKRAQALKKGKDEGHDTQRQRWAKLLDGTLKVEELDDDEISRCRVKGRGGNFSGIAPSVPSHLLAQFQAEQMKRTKALLSKHLLAGAEAMGNIIKDPEAKDADKIKAFTVMADRILGRNPETVHIKAEDPWSAMLAGGASLREIRDLSDLAGEGVDTPSAE